MSTKKKATRDSQGRFITPGNEEDVIDGNFGQDKFKLFSKLRLLIFSLIMIILSIPWSVIFFQPAKNMGNNFYNYVGNITDGFKDSFCDCNIARTLRDPKF